MKIPYVDGWAGGRSYDHPGTDWNTAPRAMSVAVPSLPGVAIPTHPTAPDPITPRQKVEHYELVLLAGGLPVYQLVRRVARASCSDPNLGELLAGVDLPRIVSNEPRRTPIKALAHRLAEAIATTELERQRWADIEWEAALQGIDTRRPARRRKSIPTQPSLAPRPLLMFYGRGLSDEEREEYRDREEWLDGCAALLRWGLRAAGCRVRVIP